MMIVSACTANVPAAACFLIHETITVMMIMVMIMMMTVSTIRCCFGPFLTRGVPTRQVGRRPCREGVEPTP